MYSFVAKSGSLNIVLSNSISEQTYDSILDFITHNFNVENIENKNVLCDKYNMLNINGHSILLQLDDTIGILLSAFHPSANSLVEDIAKQLS